MTSAEHKLMTEVWAEPCWVQELKGFKAFLLIFTQKGAKRSGKRNEKIVMVSGGRAPPYLDPPMLCPINDNKVSTNVGPD